jgi:hypothetical protein
VALSDEELEKEIIRLFDVLGQAIYLSVKAGVKPASGQVDAMRAQWRNFARMLVTLAKKDRD